MTVTTAAEVRFEEGPRAHKASGRIGTPAAFHWESEPSTVDEWSLEEQSAAVRQFRSEPIAFHCDLLVVDAEGASFASLPIRFTERIATADAFQVVGADESGFLRLRLALPKDAVGVRLSLTTAPPMDFTPDQLVPSVALLEALEPNRLLGLWLPHGDKWGTEPVRIGDRAPQLPTGYADAVRSLARLQRLTGTEFTMPAEITTDEANTVDMALRLLAGETVKGKWTTASMTMDTRGFETMTSAAGEHGCLLEFTSPYDIELWGHEIRVGLARHRLAQALVASEATPEPDNENTVTVTLTSGENDSYEIEMLPATDDRGGDAVFELPSHLLEQYRGRWIAQRGHEVLFDGESPRQIVAQLREMDVKATVWRVPEDKTEAEVAPGVGS